MLKQNKIKIIISSLLTLLPMAFGIAVWDKLPSSMAVHFGVNGEADGFASKAMAVFGLPLILLLVYWLALVVTSFDKSQKNQNRKALGVIFWIIPIISVFANAVVYAMSLGATFDVLKLIPIMLGLLFLLIGNFLPKATQNKTLGIRTNLTLGNEENWTKTHRISGITWFVAGILCFATAFLPIEVIPFVLLGVLVVAIALPLIYSYSIYKKHKKSGVEYNAEKFKSSPFIAAICIVIILAVLGVLALVSFTGEINYNFGAESVVIEADFYSDLEIRYEDIEEVEYLLKNGAGAKINGFNSAKLLIGKFSNKAQGEHFRYTYRKTEPAVRIKVKGETLILNGKDERETKVIYVELLSGRQAILD